MSHIIMAPCYMCVLPDVYNKPCGELYLQLTIYAAICIICMPMWYEFQVMEHQVMDDKMKQEIVASLSIANNNNKITCTRRYAKQYNISIN